MDKLIFKPFVLWQTIRGKAILQGVTLIESVFAPPRTAPHPWLYSSSASFKLFVPGPCVLHETLLVSLPAVRAISLQLVSNNELLVT